MHRPSPAHALAHLGLFLVAAVVAIAFATTYMARLASPGGFLLVPVADEVVAAPPLVVRPRHTVVVLFDGLSAEDAMRISALARLCAQWPCASTDVGPITFSRPVYASLSTGLEPDRTGCRINADPRVVAAESIWEVAREDHRRVTAVTEEPWWREMFPTGFDEVTLAPTSDDFFRAPLTDLTLIHPMYIDDEAHHHGIDSAEYRAALSRADQELSSLVDRLDFKRDLLIVTADHGHVMRGGHGGREPRVAWTTTAFVGRGVARTASVGALSVTAIPGAVALLMGLRFPRDMRASADHADDLDAVQSLLDPAAFSSDYLSERRRAVETFRRENARALTGWGMPSTWPAAYAEGRSHQGRRAAVALIALVVAAFALSSRGPKRDGASRFALDRATSTDRPAPPLAPSRSAALAWTVALAAATFGGLRIAYGRFDFSAINDTATFIHETIAIALLACSALAVVHAIVFRNLAALVADLGLACGLLLVANLSQPFIDGWRVGVWLPSALGLFLPLPLAMTMLAQALVGFVAATVLFARDVLADWRAHGAAR